MSGERSSARRRGGAGAGWLATFAGAAVLLAVGFVFGLVGGAVSEAPDLVADHLAGRTAEVPLAEGAEADAPDAALARADGSGRQVPAAGAVPSQALPEGEREASRRPLGASRESAAAAGGETPDVAAPPPSAAPRGAEGFAIQVGAFRQRRAAAALADELREADLPAYVLSEERGQARHKVRVGPFRERHEAERLAARLKAERRLPTWVLSRGPGSR